MEFRKSGISIKLTDLFTETGLPGMLEEAHFDSFDVVFIFLASFVNAFCGLELSADVTDVCTTYVIMVNHIY